MDLLNLNYADFERFMYVFFRVGAFVVFVPILGSRQFPTLAKIGFILLLSFSVFPLIDPRFLPQPQGMLDLSVYLFTEFLIGLSIAFATRLVFTAVQIAGTMVDFQMGFGVVNVIDPQTETQVSVTAQFQNIFTILIYLALNAHHLTIFALLESFQQINIMEFSFGALSAAFIMKLFTSTFIIAIKIAAPVMAILFFISVGLGLVARTVPQMNVFIVGFPLQIGAGLLMVGLSLSFFGIMIKKQIMEMPNLLFGLMHTF